MNPPAPQVASQTKQNIATEPFGKREAWSQWIQRFPRTRVKLWSRRSSHQTVVFLILGNTCNLLWARRRSHLTPFSQSLSHVFPKEIAAGEDVLQGVSGATLIELALQGGIFAR